MMKLLSLVIGSLPALVLLCQYEIVYAQSDDLSSDGAPSAPTLTSANFKDTVNSETHAFVMFFAPWCGHCQQMKPTWEELASKYNTYPVTPVRIFKVDCTKDAALCSEQEIRGYPTLLYYGREEPEGKRFTGARTLDEFITFINKQLTVKAETKSGPPAVNGLYRLNGDTFHDHVQTGDHFIKFFAPWCGHCKSMEPAWKQLAETFGPDEEVKIADVDCTQDNKLCNEFEVRGFPTLLYLREGQLNEKYQGGRDYDSLLKFTGSKLKERAQIVPDIQEGRIPEMGPPVPDVDIKLPVVQLSEDSFKATIEAEDLIFVKFYAPWCGHCKRLAPVWEQLGQSFVTSRDVVIAKVDCTMESALCGENKVDSYPTLVLFRRGSRVGEYEGDRTLNDLVGYVNKHRAKDEL